MMDFNDAEKHTGPNVLIPNGTKAVVQLTLRPGGAGDGGWLRRSKSGDAMMLDCEFVVTEGQYAKRKFWTYLTISGDTEGQQKATAISRSLIRAMLESARGIDPAATDEKAVAGRRVSAYSDLDGLRFWAVIGIEAGKDGYADKNRLTAVITPDRKDWSPVDQGGATAAPAAYAQAKAAPAAGRPQWA